MGECIEREAALRAVHGQRGPCRSPAQNQMLDYLKAAVIRIPTADVAPVVHGRWAHLGGDEWCCSVCGFVITTEGSWDKPTKKYCEDCGAKMDGGGDA